MPRRRTPEERYRERVKKQQLALERYAEHEIEWAGDLITWYGLNKKDIPNDEYRACVYFMNKEYLSKPGSLTLLYKVYLDCLEELPNPTKENAFDLLGFRFKLYAAALQKGGYDGRENWG